MAKGTSANSVKSEETPSTQKETYFISSDSVMVHDGSQFLENGEEIGAARAADVIGSFPMTLASHKSYDLSDFRKDITVKVANFLKPSFDQVVLLVGAGGSVVPMKVSDPTCDSDDPDPDFGLPMSEILGAISKKLRRDSAHYLSLKHMKQLSYKDGITPPNDLEALLSQFEKAEEFIAVEQSKQFTETLNKIRSIIVDKTSYGFDARYMKHLAMINFFNRLVTEGNKLSIVTTNYDTVLEEAAAKGNYTIFDGFTFSDCPTFDAKMFDWNLVKDVPNLETKEIIYDRKVVNLLKIHGSLTWAMEDEVRRKSKSDKSSAPLLIFPSTNKYEQSYRAPYSDLFYKFRELLNRPRTLLVTVGFSFGDTHIFEMVNDAIRHNDGLSMLFTNYSIDCDESSNLKKLEKCVDEGYRVAFLKATLNDDLPTYLRLENDD